VVVATDHASAAGVTEIMLGPGEAELLPGTPIHVPAAPPDEAAAAAGAAAGGVANGFPQEQGGGSPSRSPSPSSPAADTLQTIQERYSDTATQRLTEQVDSNARKLDLLRRQSQRNARLSQPVGQQASHWKQLRVMSRTTIAISNDLKALRCMVGNFGEDSVGRSTSEIERQIYADQVSSQRGVIMPDARFRLFWDVMQVLLLVYVALVVPFRFGFSASAAPLSFAWWWEVFVDL
jgi:hypothetical protein